MKNSHYVSVIAAMAFAAVPATKAEVLSPQAALSRATASDTPLQTLSLGNAVPNLLMTQSDGGQPSVYVFDTDGNGGGYIVVSADDVAPGLLGYSATANFSEMPPSMRYWIAEYGRQIDWARSTGMPAYIAPSKQSSTHAAIAPMTTTQWNQNAPYNDDCPEINGTRCVTGCVATALAQVMKYHNWPTTGTGSYSYTPSTVGSTLSFDFGNTTFDWANMTDTYGSDATDAQKAAVAQLMFACGVASEMDYGTSESSATSFAAAQGMVKYLNYDKGLTFYNRNYYSIEDWNNLVYNQLATYGPVQYSGQSNDGGHSFVCDGYSTDGYFHINWGWGGMSDGYFLLTALDPISQGIGGSTSGYNFDQDIIGNVKPADASSPAAVAPNFVASSFVASSTQQGSSVSLGNKAMIYGPVFSYSLANVSGTYGLKLVAADGTVTWLEGTAFNNVAPQSGVYAYYVTLPASLAEGTYAVSPAVASTDGQWYDVPVLVGSEQTQSVTVADGVAQFSTTQASSVTVTDIQTLSPFYISASFEITATVTNTSQTDEYLGEVRLMLINADNQAVAEGEAYPVDLEAGDTMDMSYVSTFTAAQGTTLQAGQYYVCFVDGQGHQISDMIAITLQAASEGVLSFSNFTIAGGTENVDKHNITFTADVECTSGYFGDAITVVIFPYEAGQVSSVATFTSDPMFITAGSSANMTAAGDFANGTDGGKYFAMLYHGSARIADNQVVFTLDRNSAADDLETEPAEPVSQQLYTVGGGVPVSSDATTPGLYIRRTVMADGTVQVDKIVVH